MPNDQSGSGFRYLIALQVTFHRLPNGEILIEAPFWKHIVDLQDQLKPEISHLELLMIEVDQNYADLNGSGWVQVDPAAYKIMISSGYALANHPLSTLSKLRLAIPVFKSTRAAVRRNHIIHTVLSYDLWLPMGFFALINSIFSRRKIIYVVDIDFRKNAGMLLESGAFNKKQYFTTKLMHEPFQRLQVYLAAKYSDICLLKGKKFASDYRKVGKNIRYFLDAAHDDIHIIDRNALETRINEASEKSDRLDIVYFGRIVEYKGLQDALRALSQISTEERSGINFTIIGNGEYRTKLIELAQALDLKAQVTFKPPIPFGSDLFTELEKHDILLALPQREDTPRSALDAMAAGLPILSYDTYYYEELKSSGAVITTKWRDVDALATALCDLKKHRDRIPPLSRNAVSFAANNTQKIWLTKRVLWTKEIIH